LNAQKEQLDATTPKNVFLYNTPVMETTIVSTFLMKTNASEKVNDLNAEQKSFNVTTTDAFLNNGNAILIMIVAMAVMKKWKFVTMPHVHQINLPALMDDVFLFIGFAMAIMIVMMQQTKTHNVAHLFNVVQISFVVQADVNAYL
jgi:hypothetical protein